MRVITIAVVAALAAILCAPAHATGVDLATPEQEIADASFAQGLSVVTCVTDCDEAYNTCSIGCYLPGGCQECEDLYLACVSECEPGGGGGGGCKQCDGVPCCGACIEHVQQYPGGSTAVVEICLE